MSGAPQRDNLIALRERLKVCLDTFEKNDERLGSYGAILAVAQYLLSIGIEPRLVRPLLFSAGEWSNAAKGDASKPVIDAVQMGVAAGTVDLLKPHHRNLEETLKAVSRATGGAIEWKQLKEFRKNVRMRKRVGPVATRAYNRTLAFSKHLEDMPSDLAVETALHALGQLVVVGKKA